jgi:NhaP-type Na+/H+ or K+/H+ antiporter
LAASGLELLSLLVKQDYSADLMIIVGVIFYTVVSGVASAWLFRWSRSVLPGYVNNVVFGVVSMFR